MPLISSSKVVITGSSQISGSSTFSSTIGLSGSLSIYHDGNSNDDGFIQFTEVAASADPVANKGKIYCKEDSGTKLIFRQGSTETDLLAGGGSARWTSFRRLSMVVGTGAENTAYFPGDVDTSYSHDKFQTLATYADAVTGSAINVPAKWLSGHFAGPWTRVARDCTLETIVATTGGGGGTKDSMRVRVWAGQPAGGAYLTGSNTTGGFSGNDEGVVLDAVGHADMTIDNTTALTATNVYTVATSLTSSNSLSAGDFVLVSMIPIGGTHTGTSYVSIMLEFEES